MTNDAGVAVRDSEGKRITHKLARGENARVVASRLTLKIFHSRRDESSEFNRTIRPSEYPPCPCLWTRISVSKATSGAPRRRGQPNRRRVFAVAVTGSARGCCRVVAMLACEQHKSLALRSEAESALVRKRRVCSASSEMGMGHERTQSANRPI